MLLLKISRNQIKYREIRKLGWEFPLCIDEIREHSDIDKRMSDLFQKFLNINREYVLRVMNRIFNKDFRLHKNIIKIIVGYF
jgi:hypothetical protein